MVKFLTFISSAVNGWLPKRIQEEIVWNSTANLTGEPSGNLALDLVNEFQNNDFKGMLFWYMYHSKKYCKNHFIEKIFFFKKFDKGKKV